MNTAASGIYRNGTWRERVATALVPPKKRGPRKGKAAGMGCRTMGAISMFMQGTKL